MSYKVYIYALMLLLTSYAFSGLNFNGVFKTNHKIEARVLVMLLVMSVAYLASNFIISFIEAS